MSIFLPSLPPLIEHDLKPTSKVQKKNPSPPPTNPTKSQQKPKPKMSRKKKVAVDDDDDEDDNEKTVKYIQNFEDMLRLKEIYQEKYNAALLRKVASQRETIRKNTERIDQNFKERELKEKADRHASKKRFERYDLTHDASFLQNIPKSKEYKKLLKEKREKAATKSSKVNPSQQEGKTTNYLPAPPETDEGRVALPDSLSRQRVHTMPVLPEGSRDTSAGTRAPADRQSSKGRSESDVRRGSSTVKTLAELDKLMPPIEMPRFRSLEDDFLPPPVDVDAALGCSTRHEEKQSRKIYLKHLQYMFNMSAANRAATQRIMARSEAEDSFYDDDDDDGELFHVIEEDDDDLFSLEERLAIQARDRSYQENAEEIARQWSVVLAARPLSDIQEENAEESAISRFSKTTLSDATSLPLTMDQVIQQSKTLSPKAKSTLWPNYLKAGKSLFQRNVPILNFEHPYRPDSK